MASDASDDYYVLLGIDAGADDAELRRAWRRIALQWHPDRAGPDATATFQRMSAAYTVLTDPVARAAYDRRRGRTERGSPTPAEPAAAPAATAGRRAPGIGIRRLSGPLNGLLARGVARHAEPGIIELFLDSEEVAEGGMVVISMRVPVHCRACGPDAIGACSSCDGTRAVEDVFSAWLAIRPGVADGTILTPSAWLPGMVRRVHFRVRLGGPG